MRTRENVDWTEYIDQAQRRFRAQRDKAIRLEIDALTERVMVHKDAPQSHKLEQLARRANDMFNIIVYYYRQNFLRNDYINYRKLKGLPERLYAHEQVKMPSLGYVQLLHQKIRSIFRDFEKKNEAYRRNPADFSQRPKLPYYRHHGGMCTFYVAPDDWVVHGQHLMIPELDHLSIKLQCPVEDVAQVRIVPKIDVFIAEVIYHTRTQRAYRDDNHRYLAIDPGIDNAFTLTTNVPRITPVIINGRPLKSFNHHWNQQVNRLQEQHAQYKQPTMSNEIKRLQRVRYSKIERFAHAASRYIVQYALKHNMHTIVIGDNKSKKDLDYNSQRITDAFIELPYRPFLDKIRYKGARVGIAVVVVSESYTSQTSFLDHERPIWDNGDNARRRNHLATNSRRVKRGLFLSNQNRLVNADVNGSLQILKRAVPNAFQDGIRGIGLYPVKRNLDF